MRLLRSLERVWHDVRYGCRVFARSPGFTAIAVLSIACGTGANVAMFSVADALLLRPLPVPDPDDLLVVGMRTDRSVIVTAASYPDYADIRDRSQTFDGLLAYTLRWTPVSTAAGASPQIKVVQLVTANFFDVLQVRPALGRAFAAGEDRVPGRDPVALISHAMWQQQFAADPDVVGRSIRVSGVPFTIVGVTPEGFTGLETRGFAETVYVPLSMAPALGDEAIRAILTTRDLRLLSVRGRLEPGVGITEARAELESIGLDLERAHPATNRDQPLIVQTEIELRFADRIDAGLVALLSILSSVVLAVACANVAGLLASRAPVRAREISLRLALGAGRGRLVRQLITESLALALAGGVCGLAVGRAGILILQQMQYPTDSIQPPSFQLDERALVFSLAIAMASAFLFGIGPALQTTRVDLAGSIRNGDVAVPRRWRLSLRTSLVATQVALSLVLITIAVFTLQIFKRVATTGPGFRTTQMAKVSVDTTHRQYSDQQVTALAEQAVQAAERLPGVTSATVTSRMPFWGMEPCRSCRKAIDSRLVRPACGRSRPRSATTTSRPWTFRSCAGGRSGRSIPPTRRSWRSSTRRSRSGTGRIGMPSAAASGSQAIRRRGCRSSAWPGTRSTSTSSSRRRKRCSSRSVSGHAARSCCWPERPASRCQPCARSATSSARSTRSCRSSTPRRSKCSTRCAQPAFSRSRPRWWAASA